jgi:hypothetical protein
MYCILVLQQWECLIDVQSWIFGDYNIEVLQSQQQQPQQQTINLEIKNRIGRI